MINKKSRLNTHVIVKYFYPVTAGIETNVMETYSVLAKESMDVTIHTSKDTATEKNSLADKDLIRGLKVKRYPFSKFGFFPQLDWKSADLICLHNFDIFPHLILLFYIFYLKVIHQKNFALVLTPHGGFNPEWRVFSKMQAFIKRSYHYSLGTFLINSVVDGIRAVSKWEKSEMISSGLRPEKIMVIDNGIEDEAYLNVNKLASQDIKKRVKEFGKYIIQVGRIYPIKNYETTIKALPNVPKDIKFVIVGPEDHILGKSSYKQKLEDLAKEQGVEGRVIFAGVVRGVDKYYLISKAQMMVHMAIWESYCNVVHEGLSQGLVCIVANNTALPLLIKNGVNGYCVPTHDWRKVAEKINYVLNNKNADFILDIRKRNRLYGLENSWRKVAARVYLFYKSLLPSDRQSN